MDKSSQFFKSVKFQQIVKCSEFHMIIEDVSVIKSGEIDSKHIKFLDSDDVWWISIKKFIHTTNRGVIRLEFFLHATDCIWKSRIWTCSVSGTVDGKQINTGPKGICEKQTLIVHEIFGVDMQKRPFMELKLEMKISLNGGSKVCLQKFIDQTRHYKQIISNNESILNESKYSDFTFIVHEKVFKVHKCVLAAASPVFERLFETKFREAVSNECRVTDIEPHIFQFLLNFIYAGKLPEELHEENVARKLFEAAHYYEINGLRDICTSVELYKLSKKNAVDIYEWADTFELDSIKMEAWKIIQFNILEIFDVKEPPPIHAIRSLIAMKKEKKKLLEECRLKLSKLEATTKDLFK